MKGFNSCFVNSRVFSLFQKVETFSLFWFLPTFRRAAASKLLRFDKTQCKDDTDAALRERKGKFGVRMIRTHCKTPSARFLVGGLGGEGVRTWAFCFVGVGG